MGLQLSFSWIIVIWSMVASACLTLMAVHLMIWFQKRTAWANLFFALTAGGMAALLFCDLRVQQSRTPAEYGMALRWFQVPMWVILVSLIGFVRTSMRAGRWWLAWTAGGLRTLTLILNFIVPPNIIFGEAMALCRIQMVGESVPRPMGLANPWMLVCQLSLLVYLAFMGDVAFTLWRRKERVLMRVLSGALVVMTLYFLNQALQMSCGNTSALMIYCLFFLGIVGIMAWDLSWGYIRTAQLSDTLRDNEQRFKTIYDSVADVIFHLKVEAAGQYRFISVNQSFCRATGLRQDQIVGKPVNEVIPEPSLTIVLGKYRQAIEMNTVVCWEETTDYPTGRLTGEVRIAPVFINGIGTFLLGAVHDITERKQAEEALRESEETLRSIFVSSPDSITVADFNERIKLCNQSTANIHGYSSPEELIGVSLYDLVAKEDHPSMETAKQYVMAHGFAKDLPFTGLKKSGEKFSGELSFSVLKDGSGKPVGFVGITRDISTRKAAEQKLDEQRHELVHLSRVSTLSELSSSLAHELNQPLLGIRSNAQAAQRFLGRLNPDLKEIGDILDDIITDNKRAANVIVKLRDLYKKATYEFTPIDMNHLIREVLSMVRSYVIIKDVSVTCAFDEDIPVMTGDKTQLQQVILNLVLNSFDAMESRSGGKRLRIRTVQEGGTHIVTSIEDNGAGIDARSRDRLFSPFFTTKEKGMGMGLVISKTIVESHGGTIWADDRPGQGAAFHFRLPIVKGETP